MKSYCHQNTRQLIAHHLCPFHLLAPVIKLGYRTRKKWVKAAAMTMVRGYDWGYRKAYYTTVDPVSRLTTYGFNRLSCLNRSTSM